jgi:hypothetical protein
VSVISAIRSRFERTANTASQQSLEDQIERGVRWHREHRDAKENIDGLPPESEEIRHQCVWVVEAYPPSLVKGLAEGLQKHGWAVPTFAHSIDAVAWLDDSRKGLFGGGWLNLGVITSPESQGGWMQHRVMSLPEGIEYIIGGLYQTLPSVTFAVFQFVLSVDSRDRGVEECLRRQYQSIGERTSGGYTIHTPENQRIAAVRESRRDLRRSCENWTGSHFPGFFSRTNATTKRGFPTCELITFKEKRGFELGTPEKVPNFLWTIGIESPFGAWQSAELPGLRFGQALDRMQGDEPWAWILAGRWSEIFSDDEELKGYGDRTRDGITSRLSMTFGRTPVMLALWAMLNEWAEQLSTQRDKVARLIAPNQLGALLEVQTELGSQQGDLGPILDEVQRLATNEKRFMYDLCEFLPVDERLFKGPLFKWMLENIMAQLEIMRAREAAIRQSITIATETIQAITQHKLAAVNLTLQQTMTWLTFVGIVVAVIALVVGLPQALPKWREWLLWWLRLAQAN